MCDGETDTTGRPGDDTAFTVEMRWPHTGAETTIPQNHSQQYRRQRRQHQPQHDEMGWRWGCGDGDGDVDVGVGIGMVVEMEMEMWMWGRDWDGGGDGDGDAERQSFWFVKIIGTQVFAPCVRVVNGDGDGDGVIGAPPRLLVNHWS